MGRNLPLLGLVLVFTPAMGLAQPLGENTLRQIEALIQEKLSRTPAQQKLSSQLLAARRAAGLLPPITGVATSRSRVEVGVDGTVLVDIVATVTGSLLEQLNGLGGSIVNSFPQYDAIRARLPLTALETVAALPLIRSIRPADEARAGKVNTSEGDVTHRADTAREIFGATGSGVLVGVLSDSVDQLAAVQATGDLPPTCGTSPCLTVLSGQAGGPGSSEGTAMMEIVHDLAPGADLMFATAFNGQASFAANIIALKNAGAEVIVDDVFYFVEPVFQDGQIALAVNTVVDAGVTYVTLSGNDGNFNKGRSATWEGDFVASTANVGGKPALDFGGNQPQNKIKEDAESPITLKWSDPIGDSSNDYDLFLVDLNGFVLASSTNPQSGSQDPIELISSEGFNDTGNRLVVVKFSGLNRFLHLGLNGNGIGKLKINTPGATYGHEGAAKAISVGAVNVETAGCPGPFCGPFIGGGTNPVEFFSSDGPRRIFFQGPIATAQAITPGNFSSTGGRLLQKPDIAAANRISTATSGFESFPGTSAAAPHAAAVAALLRSQNPLLTASQVRSILTTATLDNESPGVDRDTGTGIVDAQLVLGPNCVGTGTRVLKGTVKTSTLSPIAGVKVKLVGEGCSNKITTDASGKYAFTSLADGDYTLKPKKSGCTFTPTTAPVTIAGANQKVNLSGSCP